MKTSKNVMKAMAAMAIVASSFILMFFIGVASVSAQGIGVNSSNSAADPSAMLDVSGTNSGVLINRMTTAQRNAIVSPANGLMIYNTDCNTINVNTGTAVAPVWSAVLMTNTNAVVATVSISASPAGTICTGTNVSFTATPTNGGASPSYQWKVNGTNVGSNSAAYSTSGLNNNDIVTCVMSSNALCVTNSPVTSNAITMTVNTITPVSTFSPASGVAGSAITFTPTVSGAVYSWTFNSGSPGSSTAQNPSVTWSSAGTYNVSLQVTVSGCSSSTTAPVSIADPCVHSSQTFNYTGSLQTFTVPACISSITIQAYGGKGGGGLYNDGGLGAYMTGTVTVTTGNILNVLVGAKGDGVLGNCWGGGGGGGSFIWNTSTGNTLLIAAAGGGGGSGSGTGGAGQISTTPSNGNGSGSGSGGSGGNGGNGGAGGSNGTGGGGGAGWNTNGNNGGASGGNPVGKGGFTPLNGGAGGPKADCDAGGYGGGGGDGYSCAGAGGGSGYNGGGGGNGWSGSYGGGGGGGGSYYINGTPGSGSASGYQSGNGQVVITY